MKALLECDYSKLIKISAWKSTTVKRQISWFKSQCIRNRRVVLKLFIKARQDFS